MEHGRAIKKNAPRVVEWASSVKPHSRSIEPKVKPLHLAELLDFRPDQGIIRLHEQRVVILSAAAMGLLRKEFNLPEGQFGKDELIEKQASPAFYGLAMRLPLCIKLVKLFADLFLLLF